MYCWLAGKRGFQQFMRFDNEVENVLFLAHSVELTTISFDLRWTQNNVLGLFLQM